MSLCHREFASEQSYWGEPLPEDIHGTSNGDPIADDLSQLALLINCLLAMGCSPDKLVCVAIPQLPERDMFRAWLSEPSPQQQQQPMVGVPDASRNRIIRVQMHRARSCAFALTERNVLRQSLALLNEKLTSLDEQTYRSVALRRESECL